MIDPELDLTLHRVIGAPRQRIWEAWTQPEKFAKWWTPAPTVTRVDRLEPEPGGGQARPGPVGRRTPRSTLAACPRHRRHVPGGVDAGLVPGQDVLLSTRVASAAVTEPQPS